MLDFSFILVDYNTAEFTRQCIDSILETPGPYEIIVVDNSEDPAPLAGIETDDGKVQLIRSGSNLGFTGGNNFGARHARGDVLVILNNDTLVLPGTIERIAAAVGAHGREDVVTGYIEKTGGGAQVSCGRFPTLLYEALKFCVFAVKYLPLPYAEKFKVRTWESNTVQPVDWCTGAFFIISRSTYLDMGGFDEKIFMYMDDVDLHKRLNVAGGRVYYHPELRIHHFGGQSAGRLSHRGVMHQYQSTRYYLRKHFGPVHAALFQLSTKTAAVLWLLLFGILFIASAGQWRKVRDKFGIFKVVLRS